MPRTDTDKPPKSASDRVVNRHMARLLTDLEDAGCPVLFRDCVKGRMKWLRDDLENDTKVKEQGNVRIHEARS